MKRDCSGLRVGECAAYAGVSQQRTRNLLRAGLPASASADRARGESRRFTQRDVLLFALADAIMRYGFDAQAAVRMLQDRQSQLHDAELSDWLEVHRGGRRVAKISLAAVAAAINTRVQNAKEST